MTTTNRTWVVWVVLIVLFVFCGGTGMPLALAQGRPAPAILADIDDLEKREPSKDTDEHDDYDVRLSALIGEFYRASPNHERLVTLLPKRWEFLSSPGRPRPVGPEERDPFFRELNDVQSRAKDQRLHDEAAYYKARTKLGIAQSRQKNPEAALPLIGVSLDPKEDGLESLKAFVQKEGIAWPQYFENGDDNGEFSLSWGIATNFKPFFVVEQDGKLYSIDARRRSLTTD